MTYNRSTLQRRLGFAIKTACGLYPIIRGLYPIKRDTTHDLHSEDILSAFVLVHVSQTPVHTHYRDTFYQSRTLNTQ